MSWYLLKDRRHEGPFTRDDLLNRVLQGELKLESYLIRSEDLERGVISYVRVSSVVGAIMPPESLGATGDARRETRDPDTIDAFVPQELPDPLPIEKIAAMAPQALDIEPADLVGRGARTQEMRVQESQTGSRPRPPSDLLMPDEPSWIENMLTARFLGRFAGALVFVWVVSLGIEQWKRPGAERQVAAIKGEKRSRSIRPARSEREKAARENRMERPRLMPTERPAPADMAQPPQMASDPASPEAPMGRGLRKRGLATPQSPEALTEPSDGRMEEPVIGEGGAEPVNGDEREPDSVDAERNDEEQIDAEPVEGGEEVVEDSGEAEVLPEEN